MKYEQPKLTTYGTIPIPIPIPTPHEGETDE